MMDGMGGTWRWFGDGVWVRVGFVGSSFFFPNPSHTILTKPYLPTDHQIPTSNPTTRSVGYIEWVSVCGLVGEFMGGGWVGSLLSPILSLSHITPLTYRQLWTIG